MTRSWRKVIALTCSVGAAAAVSSVLGCGSDLANANLTLPVCQLGQTVGCIQPTNPDAGASGAVGTPLPCDVQTLLHERCGECHGNPPLYGAPMPLVTWEDLKAPAGKSSIVDTSGLDMFQAVMTRIEDVQRPMPQKPYPALTADEHKVLEDWVNAGAPARTAGDSCASDSEITPGGGDAPFASDGDAGVVTLPDGGSTYPPIDKSGSPDDCENYYEMRAHGVTGEHDTTPFTVRGTALNEGNQYHCFYYKPPYDAEDMGLWFAPIIDNSKVIHHWLLYGTDLATQPSGSTAPCNAAEWGSYLIAGWAPGTPATNYPKEVGMQLPTSGLILEVHYFNQSGQEEPDNSGVRFCTAKKGTRAHTAAVHFTGGENICINPGANYEQDARASATTSGRNGGTGAITVGHCDPADNVGDIHIIDLWPHMHTLGRRMKVTIHRANGGGDEVIHDEAFDFNQQITYPKDVVLHPGDTMDTECDYLNDTKQQVPFGENTQREMCYGFVTAWPANSLVTDPAIAAIQSIGGIANVIQPSYRCLNATGIFDSCNQLADYPALNAN
jgi:hypothetical protein